MKILVLGATGTVGGALVARALERGHEVTAFVRDARKITTQHASLHTEIGDALDPSSLDRVMPGHDAVLFSIGPGHNRASTVRREAARNTVAAMTKAGVKRLVALSALGTGTTRQHLGFMFEQILARTTLKGVLEDQNGMEAEMRKSRLDWVVVRPGELLLDAPATWKWVLSLDGAEIARKVSCQDVVLFMLDQLESDEFVRKPVAIGMADATF